MLSAPANEWQLDSSVEHTQLEASALQIPDQLPPEFCQFVKQNANAETLSSWATKCCAPPSPPSFNATSTELPSSSPSCEQSFAEGDLGSATIPIPRSPNLTSVSESSIPDSVAAASGFMLVDKAREEERQVVSMASKGAGKVSPTFRSEVAEKMQELLHWLVERHEVDVLRNSSEPGSCSYRGRSLPSSAGEMRPSRVTNSPTSIRHSFEDKCSTITCSLQDPAHECEPAPRHNCTVVSTPSIGQVKIPLKVKIVSARGLRKADIASHSDPYCVCHIPGAASDRRQTRVVQDTESPQWDEEFEFSNYELGTSICFKVYDKDMYMDDELGEAELKSHMFFPSGFSGELLLNEGGWAEEGRRAYLFVKITFDDAVTSASRSMTRDSTSRFKVHDVWRMQRSSAPMQEMPPDMTKLISQPSPLISSSTKSIFERNSMSLHPQSYTKLVFDLVIVTLLVHDIFMVPVDMFFLLEFTTFQLVLLWLSCWFWTADIFLSFVTGAFKNGVLQMNLQIIASSYIRSWFGMDLALVTIGWTHLVIVSTLQQGRRTYVAEIFRVLRALYVFRIAKVRKSRAHDVPPQIALIFETYAAMSRTLIFYLVCLHVLSCAWYGIGRAHGDGWVHQSGVNARGNMERYLVSTCWMITLISGHGQFMDTSTINLADRSFSAGVSFLSFIFCSWLTGKITALIMQNKDNKLLKVRNTCSNYLQVRRIPADLSVRTRRSVMTCHRKHWLEQQLEQEVEMLKMLPFALQAEVCEAARGPSILHLQVLCDIYNGYPRVMQKICHKAVSEESCERGHRVFSCAEECSETYFLNSGGLEYTASSDGVAAVGKGVAMCEQALWTTWHHCGDLDTTRESRLLKLSCVDFAAAVTQTESLRHELVVFARLYVQTLNRMDRPSDMSSLPLSLDGCCEEMPNTEDHLIFLSHYKVEAGTEATLMQEAFERMIAEDPDNLAQVLMAPVFVDSENLSDLSRLKDHVIRSHSLILLLTPAVLSRPWCLIEIVTAVKNSVQIVPVELQRPGNKFTYPSEKFYEGVQSGRGLSTEAVDLLKSEGISLPDVAKSLRQVFKKIALPFSPHKTSNVRQAELNNILHRCTISSAQARAKADLHRHPSQAYAAKKKHSQTLKRIFVPGATFWHRGASSDRVGHDENDCGSPNRHSARKNYAASTQVSAGCQGL